MHFMITKHNVDSALALAEFPISQMKFFAQAITFQQKDKNFP
jgi:hypothetical protein